MILLIAAFALGATCFAIGWACCASVMPKVEESDDGLGASVEIQVKRRPDYLKVMKGGVV